jgi:ATP-dependent Clp protease adaptor protein ClpS
MVEMTLPHTLGGEPRCATAPAPGSPNPPGAPPSPSPAPTPSPANPNNDGVAVLERQEQRTEPPPLYIVLMLNDDYTPMEFVVAVLERFFNKDHEAAVQIMLKVHMDGRGVCGAFTRDIASTKVEQVYAAAKKAGHPLQCVMEKAD